LPDGSVKLVEIHPRSALFDSPAGRTELKLPAGAPIDPPRNATGPAADSRGQPADGGMMRVDPANPPPAAPQSAADRSGSGRATIVPMRPAPAAAPQPAGESAAERLRKNIQKRRAARAAAAHEGVR
jgi:general secretion pathway protein N